MLAPLWRRARVPAEEALADFGTPSGRAVCEGLGVRSAEGGDSRKVRAGEAPKAPLAMLEPSTRARASQAVFEVAGGATSRDRGTRRVAASCQMVGDKTERRAALQPWRTSLARGIACA